MNIFERKLREYKPKDKFDAFDVYSRAVISSNDEDPIYPFIKSTLKHFDFEPEWFCFAYTTFYSLESAMKFCKCFPWRDDYNREEFLDMRVSGKINKMGHERRGHQRNPINQDLMFQGFIQAMNYKRLSFISQKTFKESLKKNIPFHGSWATFKVAEVFEKAIDYGSLSVPDLGIDDRDINSNDGPIGGLKQLYGVDIEYDKSIFKTWNNFGRNLSTAWDVDLGAVESAICKFNKICNGAYYVGHDIDELSEVREIWGKKIFNDIMSENFDERFWTDDIHGVQKQYKSSYRDKNIIWNADFAKQLPEADVFQILMDTE